MKYRNKLLLCCTVLIVAGIIIAVIVVPYKHKIVRSITQESPAQETTSGFVWDALVEVPVLTTMSEVYTDRNMHLTISIQYPAIALAQHPIFAKEANDVIAAFVKGYKDDFQQRITEEFVSEGVSDFTSDLTMRFTPLLLSPTIISIRFDASEYIAGAAHPNNRVRILNYDFVKHLVLSPTDLFASSTQALPFLSAYTRSALRTLFPDLREEELRLQIIPGTEPTHTNFQEIGITKAGLIVLFEPYQVAPYARGIPEVRIPLADLSPPAQIAELITPDVKEAIRMAQENIVEAEPY